MHHSRAAAALALTSVLALSACSSSNNGSTSGGTSGSSSGSSSGSTSGRTNVTCAEAATEVNGGTLTAGSWGDIPTAFQQTPSGGTFCGTDISGDGGNLTDKITIILSSLSGSDLTNFYTPLAAAGGCTVQAGTASGTSFTCSNGGLGTINTSSDSNFIFLTYTAKF